jgi:hypothetical protein
MSAAPPSSSAKNRIDVRTLSLVQLQLLAERGSRRAKAELEGRMRAAAVGGQPAPPAPLPPPAVAPRPPTGPVPTLTERAMSQPVPAAAQPRQPAAAATIDGAANPGATPHDALAQQLALIARQDEARARADGPPRLVGVVLIAWGVLLLLGALIMLSHSGGAYYLVCGLGVAAVGGLLLRCSRWALVLHGALVLLALAWAWQLSAGSLGMALVQAAPLWIAALWMLARPLREPLQ